MTALLLSGALLAGCGGAGETKTVTETAASGSSSAAAPPPQTTESSTESTPAPPPKEGEALAARTGSVSGTKMQLELAELKRSGTTAVLTLRLTNLDEEGDPASVGGTFDDGITQRAGDEGAGSERNTLDGIFLVDTKGSKKYLVGRDANNICVCDTDLGNTSVSEDAPVVLSATYAAPPQELTAVDVFIPSFGTFKDVPLG